METWKHFTIAALVALVVLTAGVLADTPFREAVTVTAGSGSFTYSSGIANEAFSAFQVDAVYSSATATSTQTVSITTGTITNQAASEAVSATDRQVVVSNDTWHTIGDKVLITSTDTNTHTAYVVGVEK